MPLIEATQEFAYDGVLRKVGDRFEASDRDADLLYRVRRARAVGAEKPASVDVEGKKSGYNRRDMKARK